MRTRTFPFLSSAGLGATIVLATVLISSTVRAQVVGGVVVRESESGSQSLKPSGELGLFIGMVPGVAGEFANPSMQVTPGISFAAGGSIRYHLTFAYSHLSRFSGASSGIDGFDLRPLTLGFPSLIASGEGVGFAIEPLLDLIGMQAYFGHGAAAYFFSSGVGLQGVLNFRTGYISLAPFNLQFQYAGVSTGNSASVSGTGFGLNMPVRLSAGLRF